MQAYNDTAKAISVAAQGNTFIYLTELKKLCLSIIQADEITQTLQHRGDKVDRPAIFRQELQNQILSFALMRVLTPEQIKDASQTANKNYMEGLVQTPPLSPAGLLLRELESRPRQQGDRQGGRSGAGQTAALPYGEPFPGNVCEPRADLFRRCLAGSAAVAQHQPVHRPGVQGGLHSTRAGRQPRADAALTPSSSLYNFKPQGAGSERRAVP